MTAPGAAWRSWLYGIAWLLGGVAALAVSLWIITLVRWGWPADRAEQQLSILGNALYIFAATNGLVVFGLTMRAAIRNFKGSAGSLSFEADSHDAVRDGDTVTIQKDAP